jgi:hypothetical protein
MAQVPDTTIVSLTARSMSRQSAASSRVLALAMAPLAAEESFATRDMSGLSPSFFGIHLRDEDNVPSGVILRQSLTNRNAVLYMCVHECVRA